MIYTLNLWPAALGLQPEVISTDENTAVVLLSLLLPCKQVGSSDSFITWPIHNSPLKFRGRSPSMNTQRHYCGQK